MAGYSNPSLLEMAQMVRRADAPGAYAGAAPTAMGGGTGYQSLQFGGRVGGGGRFGPDPTMGAQYRGTRFGPDPTASLPTQPVDTTQSGVTPPPVETATATPATVSPAGNLGAYGDPTQIAKQFGLNPSEFSQYFTSITPEMQAATEEATYDPYFKEQIGQLREQKGGAVAGLRQNLLQSVMGAAQADVGSGFAGGAAGGQRMLDLTRKGAETQYGDIGATYGRAKYGVKQSISGRISAGRQAIEAAKRANIATASRLYQSGAGGDDPFASSDPLGANTVVTDSAFGQNPADTAESFYTTGDSFGESGRFLPEKATINLAPEEKQSALAQAGLTPDQIQAAMAQPGADTMNVRELIYSTQG